MTDQTGRRKPRTPKATKLPGIPKPPADASASLRQYLTSVSEALEVRLGRKGDPRDAAVTFRDLIESGLAVEVYYGGGGGGGGGIGAPGTDPPGEPGVEDPTAPSNFWGAGAMYSISLWWNAARYEYGGHSYTEVYRREPSGYNEEGEPQDPGPPNLEGTDNWDPAIPADDILGTSLGTTYVDSVGPGAAYFYYIRHINVDSEAGPFAAPYPAGLFLSTTMDIDQIIGLLENQISEDWFTEELQDRLDQIEILEQFTGYYTEWEVGPDPNPSGLNGMIASLETRMGVVEKGVLDENGNPVDYVSSTQFQRQIELQAGIDGAQGDLMTTMTSEYQQGDKDNSAAITYEAETRANADSALSKDIEAVETTLGENSTQVQVLKRSVDGLKGEYSVKIQTTANGAAYVSGFGIAQSPDNPDGSGPIRSRFLVAADSFAIMNPTTYNLSDSSALNNTPAFDDYVPFMVRTDETVIDGITVPPGVYIKQAYISKAEIVQLIAGEVVADYIKGTVALAAPKIYTGTINMGELKAPDDTHPRDYPDYVTNPNKRVGNFSVDESGVMHARSASLYGVTIYASDNTVLLDAGGFATVPKSMGSNLIPNGELVHNQNTSSTSGPYEQGGPIWDNQYSETNKTAFPGWVWAERWYSGADVPSGASFYDWNNGRFVLLNSDSIQSGFIPIQSAADTFNIYVSVEMWDETSGYNPWQIILLFYDARGNEITYNNNNQLARQFLSYDDARWANENGSRPIEVTYGLSRFDAAVPISYLANATQMRVIIDSTGGGRTSFYSVYASAVPRVIDPKYARSYIRDLSVQTLMIQDEAVIVSSAVSTVDGASETIPSSGWYRSNVVTPRIEWLSEGRPSALFIQANAAMPPDVDGGASDQWETVGYRLIAARNTGFTYDVRYSPQITFQCRQQDPAFVSVGWKFTNTSVSGWYFVLYVYAANSGGRFQPVKFLRGASIIVHGIKK